MQAAREFLCAACEELHAVLQIELNLAHRVAYFLCHFQVSRGAECVMISKKFFINQASELTKKWIRHNVSYHILANLGNAAFEVQFLRIPKDYGLRYMYQQVLDSMETDATSLANNSQQCWV